MVDPRALPFVFVLLASLALFAAAAARPARGQDAASAPDPAPRNLPPDFPEVEVLRKEPGTAPGLLLISPYYSVAGAHEPVSHLAIIDNNGAPVFTRRSSPPAHNFRWHERAGLYSWNEAPANAAGPVVLLNEQLEEVARVNTVGGLAPAMMHEFLITEEGNYLFISKNPAVHDLSRYPVPDGQPATTEAQPTHDAIIQEVTPDGREVFRWNSWDHLKLSDCVAWWFFPDEYAKLNSLDLDAQGNVLASFRGCSVALKIERPSGRVLWQLGGSDPAAPDRYDQRRPAFDRPWYQPTNDPHGGFCSQHTVLETAPGTILLFDNGRCGGGADRDSRVVEYRLGNGGEAAFVRHYEPGHPTFFGGAVTELANGNWLIAWGGGPGKATLSEVDAAGRELFALRLTREPETAMTYRAYRHVGPFKGTDLRSVPAKSAPQDGHPQASRRKEAGLKPVPTKPAPQDGNPQALRRKGTDLKPVPTKPVSARRQPATAAGAR